MEKKSICWNLWKLGNWLFLSNLRLDEEITPWILPKRLTITSCHSCSNWPQVMTMYHFNQLKSNSSSFKRLAIVIATPGSLPKPPIMPWCRWGSAASSSAPGRSMPSLKDWVQLVYEKSWTWRRSNESEGGICFSRGSWTICSALGYSYRKVEGSWWRLREKRKFVDWSFHENKLD